MRKKVLKGVNDKSKFGYITPNTGYGDAYKKRYWQGMTPIVDQKSQFTPNDSILSTDRNDNLDLSSLVTDEGSQGFSNTYNNPKTKEMMLAQTNLTSDQYDNMVIQGMQVGKEVGGNQPGSAAEYKNGTIHMGEDHQNDGALETHERVHASQFDVIQQENIKKALGSSFKQEKDAKKGYNYKNYIDQPHEQYGNFAEFREKLGLQPGADITPEDLEILVKKKGLEENGLYKHYDNKNIVNALKTVAYQDNNSNQEYRIS